MMGSLLSAGFTALITLSIMGTGWVQFGSRYSLDYQLMLFAFILFILKTGNDKKMFFVILLLTVISIYMNYFGARFFS